MKEACIQWDSGFFYYESITLGCLINKILTLLKKMVANIYEKV